MEKKKGKITAEDKEFRKLHKAISSLPKPSFNNPEKAQPIKDVSVPAVISAELNSKRNFAQAEEKSQKIVDSPVILDTNTTRIEKVAKIRKKQAKKTIFRIFSYFKHHIGMLLLAIFCCVANSVFEIFIPLLIGKGVDLVIAPGQVDFNGLLKYIIYLCVCIVGFAVFKWLGTKLSNDLAYRIEEQLHNDIFKKFNKVPLKFIDGASHGDLQSRMINDVDEITNGFVEGFATFIDCLATIVLTLVFMIKINPTIALVILAVTPISVAISFVIAKLSNKLYKKQAKSLGELSGQMMEMVGNQKVVKAFMFEERSEQKFDEINVKLKDATERATFYSSLAPPVTRTLNSILYGIVAIMGCVFALGGSISVGAITTLLSYANKYSRPFNDIADVFADLQSAYVSAIRVFNVLDIENEVSDEKLPELKRCTGEVEFNNVDFSYTPQKRLIQNLNLKIKKGQKVAIVGPTGCGKSTLINLLMRFYDVTGGEIVVSGKPVTEIKRSSLRSKFGMVLQETWLFSASIRDNIAYGKPDATDEEVVLAAKRAGVHRFIQTLPQGYDTMITENGDNLSGGQKQLICIARLMLIKPPMLILDEATSNIDTRTELAISKAFNKMMKGKTSFVVAHRLSTIVSSDIILVMNKGNIIEQGSHKELLAKKGFYYNLYNSQFSRY